VVEKTHLARLHYRCLSNFHDRFHDFCLSLFGILSSFGLVQQPWPSTVTQPSWHHPQCNLTTRHFSSHQFFTHFQFQIHLTCNLEGVIGISKGFYLHRLFYRQRTSSFVAGVKYNGMCIIYVVFSCLCISLSLA